jgi:hypothetical protein
LRSSVVTCDVLKWKELCDDCDDEHTWDECPKRYGYIDEVRMTMKGERFTIETEVPRWQLFRIHVGLWIARIGVRISGLPVKITYKAERTYDPTSTGTGL